MKEIEGDGLYCFPCRATIEDDRRALALCRTCMTNPAVQTKNPRNKGFCADCLAKRQQPLSPSPMDRELDRQENAIVIAKLLKVEKELRG